MFPNIAPDGARIEQSRAQDIPRHQWAAFPVQQGAGRDSERAQPMPCEGKSVWIALSAAGRKDVREAAMTCATCPFLAKCEQDLIERIEQEHDLGDQLQAGRFFNDTGTLVGGRPFMGAHKKFNELMSARPAIVQPKRRRKAAVAPAREQHVESDVA